MKYMDEALKNDIRSIAKDLGYDDKQFVTKVINSLCRNDYVTVDDILSIDQTKAKTMKQINVNGKTYELIQKIQEVLKGKRIVMKVFLSHKMSGLTDEKVYEIRKKAEEYLTSRYGNIDIIDNFHHDNAPSDAGRIWHLGESIKMMEKADGVYFCPGWMDAKGCQIEYEICKTYGLKILN